MAHITRPERYEAAIWRGNGSDRSRWAVVGPTGCYTFPSAYGRKNAERLAARMTREAEAYQERLLDIYIGPRA